MSTDKTLADVQPGGRVRLGDQLVLAKLVGAAGLMLAEIDTCGHEVDPAYRRTLYEAWEEGKAALSAQPSPGGLGDAPRCFVSLDMLAGSRHKFGEVFDHPQGSFVRYEDHVRALAARQPVGRVQRIDGFQRAFYELADMMGMTAQTASPKEVWETQMRPALQDALAAREPIPMILHCPRCHLQHVDAPDERTPDWQNPPHRSHLCHGCGLIWRPADVPTIGVERTQTTGKNDTPFAPPARAVDLGQFRALAQRWADKAELAPSPMTAMSCSQQLLALIDSHGARNG